MAKGTEEATAMVIIMKSGASVKEISSVVNRIEEVGMKAHPIYGEERTVIGVVGDERPVDKSLFSTRWLAWKTHFPSSNPTNLPAASSASKIQP